MSPDQKTEPPGRSTAKQVRCNKDFGMPNALRPRLQVLGHSMQRTGKPTEERRHERHEVRYRGNRPKIVSQMVIRSPRKNRPQPQQ